MFPKWYSVSIVTYSSHPGKTIENEAQDANSMPFLLTRALRTLPTRQTHPVITVMAPKKHLMNTVDSFRGPVPF
jgi:hypothetical protein